MMRLALSLTAQPADAEDLVQDTLLRAYRSIDRFDGKHSRAWLFTIMRHAHVNSFRKARPALLRDGDRIDNEEATGATPEEQVVQDTLGGPMQAAFTALSPQHQEVLRMVDIAGLTYADTARVLGIPTGTVMSRLHRARAAMRRSLGPTTDRTTIEDR